ncbi:hypothetical protein SUGI_0249570 [Cryptomeria japonica]|nr:hypothetical protein SUGI_0249570 [Cryptomeria japonica]
MALSRISTLFHKINSVVTDGASELRARMDENNDTTTRKAKTIVLDMENTIINASFTPLPHYDFTLPLEEHSNITCYVQKRPGLDQLLQQLIENKIEIVIFTSTTKEFVDPILDRIDINNTIDLRLYRDSCTIEAQGVPVKDLSKLGRDLKNVVMVDDVPENYKLQPENAFPVKPFYGELTDKDLFRVIDFRKIAAMCSDVRDTIRIYEALNGSYNVKELAPHCSGKKIIVLELFDVLVKASDEPLQYHDFVISFIRDTATGLGEIVPFYVLKRLGVESFLAELAKNYKIVIFTDAQKKYADLILDKLDIDFIIEGRLYRDSCTHLDYVYVKDLTKINPSHRIRDLHLKDIFMVDVNPRCKYQPENGILVKPFDGDLDDRELFELAEFCKSAAKCNDVRDAIRLHTDSPSPKCLATRKLQNFARTAQLVLHHRRHPHLPHSSHHDHE